MESSVKDQVVSKGFLQALMSKYFVVPVRKPPPELDDLENGQSVDVDLFRGQLNPGTPKQDERRRYTRSGDDLYWFTMTKVE